MQRNFNFFQFQQFFKIFVEKLIFSKILENFAELSLSTIFLQNFSKIFSGQ